VSASGLGSAPTSASSRRCRTAVPREIEPCCDPEASPRPRRRGDRPAADPQDRHGDLACDGRWRVREGVAIGLQLWGDVEPTAMADHRVGARAHPLVQRAVAAICEPRLLTSPREAARAVAVCAAAAESLRRCPPAGDIRTSYPAPDARHGCVSRSPPTPPRCRRALTLNPGRWIVRENRAEAPRLG
jgi:hypothetical protein